MVYGQDLNDIDTDIFCKENMTNIKQPWVGFDFNIKFSIVSTFLNLQST